MNNTVIFVFDYSGNLAIDEDSATDVYKHIVYLLINTDNKIDVNFTGVNIIVCKFFSCAIGQLYKNFSPIFLNDRVSIVGLSRYQAETLDLVLETARKFYAANIISTGD